MAIFWMTWNKPPHNERIVATLETATGERYITVGVWDAKEKALINNDGLENTGHVIAWTPAKPYDGEEKQL